MLKTWEQQAITDARDGKLTKGEFEDLFQNEEWENVRDNVALLKVPEGITVILKTEAKSSWWPKLERVILPASVKTIDGWAFKYAGELKEVTGGENVRSIGPYAFDCCKKLKSVSFKQLDKIGQYAFYNCESLNLTASTMLPQKIKKGVFGNCKNLTKIIIQSGTTEIAHHAFEECEKLEEVVFGSCPSLIIDNFAFPSCNKLQKLEIPSFNTIKKNAFALCSGLKSIVLGKGGGFRRLEGESFSTLGGRDLDLFELHGVNLVEFRSRYGGPVYPKIKKLSLTNCDVGKNTLAEIKVVNLEINSGCQLAKESCEDIQVGTLNLNLSASDFAKIANNAFLGAYGKPPTPVKVVCKAFRDDTTLREELERIGFRNEKGYTIE